MPPSVSDAVTHRCPAPQSLSGMTREPGFDQGVTGPQAPEPQIYSTGRGEGSPGGGAEMDYAWNSHLIPLNKKLRLPKPSPYFIMG